MTHTAQQMQQMQQPQVSAPLLGETRLATLETKVHGIEQILSQILHKLDARSSINWAPISILVTVITVIGSMGFAWISTGQSRLEGFIARVEARAEHFVPRADLDARFTVAAQRRDDFQRITDSRIERTERDVDALQKQTASRGELDQQWLTQRVRDEAMHRRIEDLERATRRSP